MKVVDEAKYLDYEKKLFAYVSISIDLRQSTHQNLRIAQAKVGFNTVTSVAK